MNNSSNIFLIEAMIIASFLYSIPLYTMRGSCAEDIPVQKVAAMLQIVKFSPNNIVDLQNHLKTNPQDVNCIDNNGETIIHYVLKNPTLNNHLALAQSLITDTCIHLNHQNHAGDTPAHIAANNVSYFLSNQMQTDYTMLIKLMINNKADFSTLKNKQNKTALGLLEETKGISDTDGLYLNIITAFIKDPNTNLSRHSN